MYTSDRDVEEEEKTIPTSSFSSRCVTSEQLGAKINSLSKIGPLDFSSTIHRVASGTTIAIPHPVSWQTPLMV